MSAEQVTSVWQELTAATWPAKKRRRAGGGTPPKFKAGDVIGEWTLIEFWPGTWPQPHKNHERVPARWRCRCSCGAEREVRSDNLTFGASKSCGHGKRQTA